MTDVVTEVLATVNAPYGANLDAHALAALIADAKSAGDFVAPVFAFFSEVPLTAQTQFIAAMGVDAAKASAVAGQLSKLSGYTLPLAA